MNLTRILSKILLLFIIIIINRSNLIRSGTIFVKLLSGYCSYESDLLVS